MINYHVKIECRICRNIYVSTLKMSVYLIKRSDKKYSNLEKKHFSIALRLFINGWRNGNCNKYITQVDLINNQELYNRWLIKKSELKNSKIIWAFHGTPDTTNVESIIKNGFDLSLVGKNKKNTGDYGFGIYLSEYSSVAVKYSSAKFKGIILCKVLVGKQYRCPGDTIRGISLQKGYDSHTSPDGRRELVIFDTNQILPCYVIHTA